MTYHYTDQGVQTVNYRLVPHIGDWRGVTPDRQGLALMEPFLVRPGSVQEQTLLTIEPANIVLTTVKLAEEGGARRLLVRGYETDGQETTLTIKSAALDKVWRHSVRPYEIWTLELPLEGGDPVALICWRRPLG